MSFIGITATGFAVTVMHISKRLVSCGLKKSDSDAVRLIKQSVWDAISPEKPRGPLVKILEMPEMEVYFICDFDKARTMRGNAIGIWSIFSKRESLNVSYFTDTEALVLQSREVTPNLHIYNDDLGFIARRKRPARIEEIRISGEKAEFWSSKDVRLTDLIESCIASGNTQTAR